MSGGGSLDELAAALRRLHRQAGEPSTHEIGKKINYSHTTVAHAFKGARCPSWPVTKAIVTYLDGDLDEFRAYWIAVRDALDPLPEKIPKPGLTTQQLQRDQSQGRADDTGGDPSPGGERVVLRWKTRLETIEFLDEGLALEWIKARMRLGDEDE
jgi:hypothetical protein